MVDSHTHLERGEPNIWAKRAYVWGIYTWFGNAAGCLVSMVPIALPIGVILTIVTLLSGFFAFGAGVYGLRLATDAEGDTSRWHSWIGIGLSTTHLLIVAAVVGIAFVVSGGIPGLKF